MLNRFLIPWSFTAIVLLAGCGLGDDDFADTDSAILQKIVEDDAEGLYGPGLNDDGDSLFFASLTKESAKSNFSDFWKMAGNGIRFGRLITELQKEEPDIIFEEDTLAYFTANYLLKGIFKIDSAGMQYSKPLRHRFSRSISFVKRVNPATGDKWTPVTVSSAYGSSLDPATLAVNTRLAIDSIWIAVPQGVIAVDDPAEIVNYYKNPVTLHNNDSIVVFVKVRNKIDGFDRPVGFVTNGKNRDNQFRRRLEMTRIPFTDYFRKVLYIEASQKRGFNQLVIDFLTVSSINRRARPYDSYMIAVPYLVQ